MSSKWIDKVRDKIFVGGASFENFFFIFKNDFVVGDFNDFAAMNSEFGIHEAFDGGAFDNDLLDGEILGSKGKIGDMT